MLHPSLIRREPGLPATVDPAQSPPRTARVAILPDLLTWVCPPSSKLIPQSPVLVKSDNTGDAVRVKDEAVGPNVAEMHGLVEQG